MLIKDENVLLAVGMISISLGILVGRFLHFEYSGFSVSDFVEGVLIRGFSGSKSNLSDKIEVEETRINAHPNR